MVRCIWTIPIHANLAIYPRLILNTKEENFQGACKEVHLFILKYQFSWSLVLFFFRSACWISVIPTVWKKGIPYVYSSSRPGQNHDDAIRSFPELNSIKMACTRTGYRMILVHSSIKRSKFLVRAVCWSKTGIQSNNWKSVPVGIQNLCQVGSNLSFLKEEKGEMKQTSVKWMGALKLPRPPVLKGPNGGEWRIIFLEILRLCTQGVRDKREIKINHTHTTPQKQSS